MRSLEGIGSSDPRNERAAQAAQRETLDEIETEIGPEKYRQIIAALLEGNTDDLPEDLKAVVENIKRKRQKGRLH